MKDEHTYFKKMARIGHNTVIYKGTFVSNQSLSHNSIMDCGFCNKIYNILSTQNKKEGLVVWYDCFIPKCQCCKQCFIPKCCNLKVPTFINNFQSKLKSYNCGSCNKIYILVSLQKNRLPVCPNRTNSVCSEKL